MVFSVMRPTVNVPVHSCVLTVGAFFSVRCSSHST